MMNKNFILKSDGYKETHWNQLPENTTECYSYFESRGGERDKILFFGLQYVLKEHFLGQKVTMEKIDEAELFCKKYFGAELFNRHLWEYIAKEHNGFLPLKIKAVPEGTVLDGHNAMYTIVNTDPQCAWLTNFAETLLSHVWYTTTVATNGWHTKKLISSMRNVTSDTLDGVDFSLHDFGFRGVSCEEQAEVGGMAHLVNFFGTDTLVGILCAQEYYNSNDMLGFSVPASEHFTMTSWGREHEVDAYRNMLQKYPNGIVSVVSDSYDIFNACENIWGGILKEDILKRNGKLVIRPDSGDPVEVNRKLLHILWDKFGGQTNSKGYKVLDNHIGILQGDGIDYQMIDKILSMVKEEKFSAENIIFGSGGGNLMKVNRDTLKFAIKASCVTVDGMERNVSKCPITDKGKMSKSGKLKLTRKIGLQQSFVTITSNETEYENTIDELVDVYENGKLLKEYTFEDVRKRARAS